MSKADSHPFPGLRAFHETEGFLFFGRDGQSEAILAAMRRTRLLAVVGASGSGKSSLIRAGLIPYLHGGFLEPAGSRWRIAVMRPGADPLSALAQSIVEQDLLEPKPEDPDEVRKRVLLAAATLRRGGLGLAETVRLARLPEGDNILIVVDQFEELFRFDEAAKDARTGDEAAAFVKLLIEATRQTQTSVYVVLTMRSDFIGDCARFRDLPEIVTQGLYLVPRLTRAQRRDVIEGPIRVAGGTVTPRLVSRVLNDIGDDPDQLPILQHAMMRAWDHWLAQGNEDQPVDLANYEAMGGATQALSQHADEAFGSLDARGQAIARKLFQCLTEKDLDNRESRRPTRLDVIAAVADATIGETIAVVEAFRVAGRSFLMPPVAVPLEPATVIDISHESLIRGWRRLRDWVLAEAESARIYRRLAETAMLHAEGNAGLWRDPDLAVALAWRTRERPSAAWAGRYNQSWDETLRFLEASRVARDAASEAEARARWAEKRRNRWLFGTGALGLLVVAGLAGYVVHEARLAVIAEQMASESSQVAQTLRVEAENLTRISKQKEIEATRLNAISQQAMLYVVLDIINTATVFSEDRYFDKAVNALSGFDQMLVEFNSQFPDNRLWIPQVVDIKTTRASVYLRKPDYQLATKQYTDVLDLLHPFILKDAAFADYRVKFADAAMKAAYCYRNMNASDKELATLQDAKASLSDFTPSDADLGKFGLAAGMLDQNLGAALERANRKAEADPIYRDMLDWLTKAANAGEKIAAKKLGYFYRDGQGVPKSIDDSIKWFKLAADAESENALGNLYLNGVGAGPDPNEARQWYQKAADGGDANGIYNLAWMLEYGKGGDKDEAGAIQWYLKSAATGNTFAEVNLGKLYQDGRGAAQSSTEAFKWYQKAADAGYNVGEYDLASMYSLGQGVDKDELEALNWYHKAAVANYSPASNQLGIFYEGGTGGLAKNPVEAAKWYGKGAEAGNIAAEFNVGRLYESGEGVGKDDATAAKWYKRVADSADQDQFSSFDDQRIIANAAGRLGDVLFRQTSFKEASTALIQYLTMTATLEHATPTWKAPADWVAKRADTLGNAAYRLVLAKDFDDALKAADVALSATPARIFIQGNRAYALMFLDRTNEARDIYLKYRGTENVVGDKSWEQSVLADFDEFRDAGLANPLIDEIRATFAQSP